MRVLGAPWTALARGAIRRPFIGGRGLMHRRVLVVGAGGREHAIAWALAREPGVEQVVVAPGNPGMTDVATVVPAAPTDPHAMVALARDLRPDLAVIGPEAPLVAGVADALRANGIPTVGPGGEAARLEGSKALCRDVARAAGVPMAHGATFDDPDAALAEARARDGRVVVKADGLAAGKGVTVCADLDGAEAAIRASMIEGAFGDAGRTVVLEEVLTGREVSVIALCDETAVLALPAARDHKRLLDGDRGPNTGGMGAVSPVDQPDDAQVAAILDLVHRPILAELARRGVGYRGVLFAGLMLTEDGPRLLECNVRFGDPETQATLPRLAVPLAPLLDGVAHGRLADVARELGVVGSLLPVTPDAVAAVVLAAPGYPDAPRTGDAIEGITDARTSGTAVFCAGVGGTPGGPLTAGGRVLTVVGRGPSMGQALEAAYAGAAHIRFPGMQLRSDIGRSGPTTTPVVAGTAA
ncbi:MAG: phosphoribosylamine--glycine ligase [Chloroflexota bacterium]